MEQNRRAPVSRSIIPWVLLAIILPVLIGVIWISSVTTSFFPSSQINSTTISHSVAVEKVQKVAKLISTETTLRDVVIYENSWYGSTKRSLVVVTGKVLAGINLDAGSSVQIDEPAKRIFITLPRPGILGIEITELKTYDEQRGWWNPFSPADRDAIFQIAREQLEKTSLELKITDTAEQGARELLEGMFRTNEYTVEVSYR